MMKVIVAEVGKYVMVNNTNNSGSCSATVRCIYGMVYHEATNGIGCDAEHLCRYTNRVESLFEAAI
jgi:hypothetical protein